MKAVEEGDFAFALSLAFGKGHWSVVYFLMGRDEDLVRDLSKMLMAY